MKTLRYAKALQAEGFHVCVYVAEETSLYVHALELELPTHVIQRNKKYFDFKHARLVAKQFEKDKIDAVHFSDTRDLDFLGWVKYFSKRKIKLAYHQAMLLGVTKKDLIHTLRFKRIDAWVSTLNYMQRQVLTHTRLSADKLHIIPIGTAISASSRMSKEKAREALNLSMDKFVVGVVGRLDKKKGQLEVIQAIPLVQQSKENLQVVFVGDQTKNESDDYVQELKKCVVNAQLEDVVTFIPHQPHIQHMYNAFDLVLVPSYEETFGMVTIEAMACGVAVIGSNTAGTAEILENEDFLFEPKNPKKLGQTWLEVMTNDSKRMNWAIQLEHKFQEKYSMSSSINAWKQLLINMVERD